MFKNLLGTIGARYLVAILNLVLIVVNGKVLGLEGVGLIGILISSVNIVVIFCGILSGNTLVYFMNRYSIRTLFPIAYGWSILIALLVCGLMWFLQLIPEGYFTTILLLTLLNSFVTANARFLLGKDRIKAFNLVYILQGVSLFLILLFLYFGVDRPNVGSYILATYVSNLLALLLSFVWIKGYLKEKEEKRIVRRSIIREMFGYGLWASLDNLAENLTTRLNYFLLQSFGGLGSVGLLDSGTKISESVWHISRSVSLLEYNSVARTNQMNEQKRITLQLFKFTFFALLLVMGIIACIPEWVYTEILLKPEFVGIRKIILCLSIGIVAFGCNNVLSHFFIGSGRIRLSAYCSLIGIVILAVVSLLLTPMYGAWGAAISCSIAFSGMLLFSLLTFLRITQSYFSEFMVSIEDCRFIYSKIRSIIFNK